MIIGRRIAAATMAAIVLGVGVLAGCSSAPTTPEAAAAAKAQEWREAAYGGDQSRLDALYCEGRQSSWDATKDKDWPGDRNSRFDAPKPDASGNEAHYDVVLRNPEWSSAIHVVIDTSADPACVEYVG